VKEKTTKETLLTYVSMAAMLIWLVSSTKLNIDQNKRNNEYRVILDDMNNRNNEYRVILDDMNNRSATTLTSKYYGHSLKREPLGTGPIIINKNSAFPVVDEAIHNGIQYTHNLLMVMKKGYDLNEIETVINLNNGGQLLILELNSLPDNAKERILEYAIEDYTLSTSDLEGKKYVATIIGPTAIAYADVIDLMNKNQTPANIYVLNNPSVDIIFVEKDINIQDLIKKNTPHVKTLQMKNK
jgi:hypothetical protein